MQKEKEEASLGRKTSVEKASPPLRGLYWKQGGILVPGEKLKYRLHQHTDQRKHSVAQRTTLLLQCVHKENKRQIFPSKKQIKVD